MQEERYLWLDLSVTLFLEIREEPVPVRTGTLMRRINLTERALNLSLGSLTALTHTWSDSKTWANTHGMTEGAVEDQ